MIPIRPTAAIPNRVIGLGSGTGAMPSAAINRVADYQAVRIAENVNAQVDRWGDRYRSKSGILSQKFGENNVSSGMVRVGKADTINLTIRNTRDVTGDPSGRAPRDKAVNLHILDTPQ